MKRRIIGAAMIGHMVESYDFVIYGSSAVVIAKNFFPRDDPALALLSTLAVYGIAFVIRPLGGAVFGSLGDRRGRRAALSTAVLIMALATAAIALLPGYAVIGAAAPALLLACRLAQGLSMGAEYTSAASYILEQAPHRHRGLWVSLVTSATWIGSALAAFLLLAFQAAAPAAYTVWTWRIPFLLGGVMALVGLYMRLRLEETPTFQDLAAHGQTVKSPIRETFRHRRVFLILLAMFSLLAVVAQNLVGYLPTYLVTTAGAHLSTSLAVGGVALLLCAVLSVGAGALSDRFGRRPPLLAGIVVAIVTSVPAYAIAGAGTGISTLAAEVLLVIPAALIAVPATIVAVEAVPAPIRATSTALTYNIAYAVLGGTAPLVGALLTTRFGPLAPGTYIAVLAVLALVTVARVLPETRGTDDGRGHVHQSRTGNRNVRREARRPQLPS